MNRKRVYSVILLITFLIGVIHGAISSSFYIFLSWIFVGFWLTFTLYFLKKVKFAREYNSPKNTTFFVFGPLLIGLFYNFWGYYTGFLGENLLEAANIYLSAWVLLFALPYLLYSLYIVYCCFTKFQLVHIGRKSYSARKFGSIASLLWIIAGILNPLFSTMISDYFAIFRTNIYFDLILLLLSLIALFILIIYGVGSSRRSITDVSPEYIALRRSQIDALQRAPATRSQAPVRRTPEATTRTTSQTSVRRTPQGTTFRRTQKTESKTSTRPSPSRTQKGKSVNTKTKTFKLANLVPKTGALAMEDFKCIFCFELPKLPRDEKRGIILCPQCKHPAHADEFKDWLKNSTLCSRCDTQIPASFVQSPEIIPTKVYLKAIEALRKKNNIR